MRFGLSRCARAAARRAASRSTTCSRARSPRATCPPRRSTGGSPYVAALFLFIWVLNIVGFIPLPISERALHVFAGVEVPTLGLYAATANLSVTLALALITFVATHVEGIRYNGVVAYFKSWIPAGVPRGCSPDHSASR